VSLAGNFTGTGNDEFTFSVVGSGTVGVTPNLSLEARNNAGQLLATWNVGQGYEPGSELPGVQGIKARIGAGTLNNGDNLSTRVIAQPDTAGILTALGLNSFFQGDTPGTLQVRPDLVLRPELLSGSRSGLPADGTNWRRLATEMEAPTVAGGVSNMRKFLTDLTTDVGSQVQDLGQRQGGLEALGEGLEAERQNVSGVDPNEELMRLLQYQRSFQLSSRFLVVVNETLQELMRLV
jgi:flagellar hook-associated protein 1 FlgK